jgi:hypothetical protein
VVPLSVSIAPVPCNHRGVLSLCLGAHKHSKLIPTAHVVAVQATCPVCSKPLTIDLTNTAGAAGAADGAGSSKAAAAAGGSSSRVKANSILTRVDR